MLSPVLNQHLNDPVQPSRRGVACKRLVLNSSLVEVETLHQQAENVLECEV